ncbi:MAG: ribosomal protein S5P -alanine acetyltransferase [Caballeronia sp.]|jgi:[ribosomal protein S5]-alanine N-acetyltransferase|uniref:GNAT family N-acetyltransferase n=1 Tax=Caballeronia sp. TaxID=1931223 RepID=UPI002634656B|nr:GNAT family N-acetyltransferase [Caballeronia sp.]MDB5834085.1 ribosomal protein S5P -alanine acetyltransferase [Caballeronia sp.]
MSNTIRKGALPQMAIEAEHRAMAQFPPEGLKTERVVLRPAGSQYTGALLIYRLTNRAHLDRWEPLREDAFFTMQAANERMALMESAMAAGTALHLLIFTSERRNVLIGDCHFTNIVRGSFQACHLGYSIDQHYEGRGLMREALVAALGFIFDAYRLHRVMASYRPENDRSGRLLASLGFEHEGLAKAYLKIDGQWADHVLTSLVNPKD